ncbi:hypothetical protein [Haloechinothrix salitolerans]|uniref:Membrane protein YkvI n=1 Tax=Haloechinothrix salitolerans TaxID=926830 RepID=A0ABW2C1H5_9PSEU
MGRASITGRKSSSGLSRALVPALTFVAVGVGGAFATGREVIEFGAAYGALGWGTGVSVIVAFALIGYIFYEMARRHQLFDYRSMLRHLIGRFYWLFDVVYVFLALIILGVLASGSGSILEVTLGLNHWIGVGLVVVATGLVVFSGTQFIERFNGINSTLLIFGYVLFGLLVIPGNWGQVVNILNSGNHELQPDASIWSAALTGLVYAGLATVVFPATLITVRHLRSRREAVAAAGLTSGFFALLWFLTYFSLIGFYPQEDVFDAPVPWLQMLQGQGNWVVVVYGILVGWTLIATAVGLTHAVLVRVDQNLRDFGRQPLSGRARGGVTVGVLVVCLGLAQIGIIDLIAVGYFAGGVALIAVFVVPLVLRGGNLFLPGTNVVYLPDRSDSKLETERTAAHD